MNDDEEIESPEPSGVWERVEVDRTVDFTNSVIMIGLPHDWGTMYLNDKRAGL